MVYVQRCRVITAACVWMMVGVMSEVRVMVHGLGETGVNVGMSVMMGRGLL